MPLVETGTASLDIGAIADGEYLKRSGTTITSGAPGGTGAPTNATYITQTAHADLSAEQAMGSLATGLVKNTTGTGVQGIATLGKDYGINCWMHDAFAGLAGGVIGAGSYNEAGAWADDTMAAGSTATASGGILTLTNKAAAGATTSQISSTITTATAMNGGGRVHFKMRINQDAANYTGGIVIEDGTNSPFHIYFRYATTFQISFWNGASAKIQDCSKNTWYTIDAVWGTTGNTAGPVTIFVDGAWAYKGTLGTYSTAWNKLKWKSASPAGGNDCVLDVDDFYLYSDKPLFGI